MAKDSGGLRGRLPRYQDLIHPIKPHHALAVEGVFLYDGDVADPSLLAHRIPGLILASRSPRRAQLLRDAGYRFTQIDPPFADPPQPARSAAAPSALAMELAAAKARSALTQSSVSQWDAALIIGADTIVVSPDGSLLGQPATGADAKHMVRMLLNRTHQVVTGVCLLATGCSAQAAGAGGDSGNQQVKCFSDVASVTLGDPGPAEVARYLAGGDWRGKAGAYNLTELGSLWKASVEGDPTTVVGLPMRLLAQVLPRWGVEPIRR